MSAESVAAAGAARWRAGRQRPEHLYRDELPVATMPAHVVAEVVEGMNRAGDPTPSLEGLASGVLRVLEKHHPLGELDIFACRCGWTAHPLRYATWVELFAAHQVDALREAGYRVRHWLEEA